MTKQTEALIKALEKAIHKNQRAYWAGKTTDDAPSIIASELEAMGIGAVLICPINAKQSAWFDLSSMSF